MKYNDAEPSKIAQFCHVAHINPLTDARTLGANNAAANISVHVMDGL